ncbi:GNAT family N-acetyltransferase [Salmonella enterica]
MNEFISYQVNQDPVWSEEEQDIIDGQEYWLIAKVFVPLEKRGNGIARKLMSNAIIEMKAERPDLSIKLWCESQDSDTDDELLSAFYESFGFSFTGNGAEMELK